MKPVVAAAAVFALAFALAPVALANQTDTNFLDGMTHHHHGGIHMSEMAVRKASSPELRALAEKMIADQRKDNEVFERLRDGEVQPQRPELADMPGMTGMNMKWLEAKSGAEFDRAFAIAMIDHHMGAMKMVDHEISKGGRAAVKSKAREIRAKQRKEIRELAKFK